MKKLVLILLTFTPVYPQKLTEEVKKINNDLYVEKKGDLYFGLERVTENNVTFWNKYAENQQKLAKNKKDLITPMATIPFRSFIKGYQKNDVWVAYATSKKITANSIDLPLSQTGDIEMVVTVTTNPEIPFSTHMGIFRAVDFEPRHKGISMDLHSFAAKAIKLIYSNKEYMITKPAKQMADILIKALPNDTFWKNGDKNTLSKSDEHGIMTILTQSGKKIAFDEPDFFKKQDILQNISALTIINLDTLVHYQRVSDKKKDIV